MRVYEGTCEGSRVEVPTRLYIGVPKCLQRPLLPDTLSPDGISVDITSRSLLPPVSQVHCHRRGVDLIFVNHLQHQTHGSGIPEQGLEGPTLEN